MDDDLVIQAAKAQVGGWIGEVCGALVNDGSPREVVRVMEFLERAMGTVIDGLAGKLTAARPVVDADTYAALEHVLTLADRALCSDRSELRFYLDAIRKEVESLKARGMQPAGSPDAREQAREVRRLVEVFLQGCANTALLGKPPEECPGCAADFVERVRKAVGASIQSESEVKGPGQLPPDMLACLEGDPATSRIVWEHGRVERHPAVEARLGIDYKPMIERTPQLNESVITAKWSAAGDVTEATVRRPDGVVVHLQRAEREGEPAYLSRCFIDGVPWRELEGGPSWCSVDQALKLVLAQPPGEPTRGDWDKARQMVKGAAAKDSP